MPFLISLTGSQHCDTKIQQIICISIHGSLIQNFIESVLNIPHTSPLPLNNLVCKLGVCCISSVLLINVFYGTWKFGCQGWVTFIKFGQVAKWRQRESRYNEPLVIQASFPNQQRQEVACVQITANDSASNIHHLCHQPSEYQRLHTGTLQSKVFRQMLQHLRKSDLSRSATKVC